MSDRLNKYAVRVVTSDSLIMTGAGVLNTISLSQTDAAPTAGSIDVYDGIDTTGKKILSITLTTATFTPRSFDLKCQINTGIYVDFTTIADVNVTVTYGL